MPIERQETGLSLSRVAQADPTKSRTPHRPADDDSILYKGNCHCGKNRFEARLPDITSALGCNCSLCHKSGYLWAFPDADSVKYTRGDKDTLRTFETEVLRHEFCTSCGTGLYGTHKAGPLKDQSGVNVRAILDVNPFKIDCDIAEFIPSTAATLVEIPITLPSTLKVQEPPAQLEGDNIKLYTGSCQCGAVAFVVKTAALPGIEVKEDNCSICVRRAAMSIYPDRDQVILLGKDNTTTYAFGRKFNHAPFCKTCGVACYAVAIGPPQAAVDEMPENMRDFVEKQRRIQPLYVRALNGVEWDDIKIERSDEGTDGYEVSDE